MALHTGKMSTCKKTKLLTNAELQCVSFSAALPVMRSSVIGHRPAEHELRRPEQQTQHPLVKNLKPNIRWQQKEFQMFNRFKEIGTDAVRNAFLYLQKVMLVVIIFVILFYLIVFILH